MLRNLLIVILSALSAVLIVDNPRLCAQIPGCRQLQDFIGERNLQRQQQVEAVLQMIRLSR